MLFPITLCLFDLQLKVSDEKLKENQSSLIVSTAPNIQHYVSQIESLQNEVSAFKLKLQLVEREKLSSEQQGKREAHILQLESALGNSQKLLKDGQVKLDGIVGQHEKQVAELNIQIQKESSRISELEKQQSDYARINNELKTFKVRTPFTLLFNPNRVSSSDGIVVNSPWTHNPYKSLESYKNHYPILNFNSLKQTRNLNLRAPISTM